MKAEIKAFYSADVDVATYTPADTANDGVWVRMICGPHGQPGEESFDVLVCTPAWLSRKATTEGQFIGRHLLIQNRFDLSAAESYLAQLVSSMPDGNWHDLASKIARIGKWEFEDYQP